MFKARLGLQPLILFLSFFSRQEYVYFNETMKLVNYQNMRKSFPNTVNANHCCNLQW